MSRILPRLVASLVVLSAPALADVPALPLLRDRDRIVFIGDAFVESDQKYGYLETLLTASHPDQTFTFRNLGWSGDTVRGDARAGFGTQADGFRQLKDHVAALRPNLIVVGYGMADSLEPSATVESFTKGLETLLETIATGDARVVLLSPLAHEDLGRPLPDPTRHNQVLDRFTEAIRGVAASRHALFVPLLRLDSSRPPAQSPHSEFPPLTTDGIHLNPRGYWAVDHAIARALASQPSRDWIVALDAKGDLKESRATRVSDVAATPHGLRFEARDDQLPDPPPPSNAAIPTWLRPRKRQLKVAGLAPGSYALKIDGQVVARGPAARFESMDLAAGPEFDQVEKLRATIHAKNLQYFHRWRPENETYLFGFRKHEQGNNAREIPVFDELVDAREKEIASLRKPVPHRYELIREAGAN